MNKKTILVVFLLIIVLFSSNVLAATVSSKNATLEIVENNICSINITNYAKFEKKIIDYNLNTKEITIGLQVVNNGISYIDKPCEIVLLLDNSASMKETIYTGESRMKTISDSAKAFSTELLKHPTVRLSVVSFSTVDNGDKVYGQDGYIEEGTLADAKLRAELTNNKNTIMNAIDAVANDTTGVRTDIEAGLTIANEQFSGTVENKYIILLTDGVPNISLGSNQIRYSEPTTTNTKNKLISLSNAGINIISMMTGVTDDIEIQTGKTFEELAEETFGTPENPTVGKFYYITDNEIEETVSNRILNDLKTPVEGVLDDVDIVDYFPQNIVDNFDFSIVKNPTKGTVSQSIDLENNDIVWHIDSLSFGETATMSYKLKLKENINDEISGIVLNTNEQIDVSYEDIVPISSNVSPKIKVTITKSQIQQKDDTITPNPLPQTGSLISTYMLYFSLMTLACSFGIVSLVRNRKLK